MDKDSGSRKACGGTRGQSPGAPTSSGRISFLDMFLGDAGHPPISHGWLIPLNCNTWGPRLKLASPMNSTFPQLPALLHHLSSSRGDPAWHYMWLKSFLFVFFSYKDKNFLFAPEIGSNPACLSLHLFPQSKNDALVLQSNVPLSLPATYTTFGLESEDNFLPFPHKVK